MAMSKVDFAKFAASTIHNNYDGDPLALSAFIDSVELLKEFPTNDELNNVFLRFIKSKLQGKARECIPENAANIDEIITALKQSIVPDNSKVIAGRLLALRPDKSKIAEFTEQAEKIANALQRSLVIESQSEARVMCMTHKHRCSKGG